jgi:Na+-driven multidrug efflux pump
MLPAALLFVGLIAALAFVSGRSDSRARGEAAVFGCLGSIVLAILTIIVVTFGLFFYRWLMGYPLHSVLDEWIPFFSVVIFGCAGLGWLLGGFAAYLFQIRD